MNHPEGFEPLTPEVFKLLMQRLQPTQDARIDAQAALIDQLTLEVQALTIERNEALAVLERVEEERHVLSALCGKLLLVQAVAWREGRVYADN